MQSYNMDVDNFETYEDSSDGFNTPPENNNLESYEEAIISLLKHEEDTNHQSNHQQYQQPKLKLDITNSNNLRQGSQINAPINFGHNNNINSTNSNVNSSMQHQNMQMQLPQNNFPMIIVPPQVFSKSFHQFQILNSEPIDENTKIVAKILEFSNRIPLASRQYQEPDYKIVSSNIIAIKFKIAGLWELSIGKATAKIPVLGRRKGGPAPVVITQPIIQYQTIPQNYGYQHQTVDLSPPAGNSPPHPQQMYVHQNQIQQHQEEVIEPSNSKKRKYIAFDTPQTNNAEHRYNAGVQLPPSPIRNSQGTPSSNTPTNSDSDSDSGHENSVDLQRRVNAIFHGPKGQNIMGPVEYVISKVGKEIFENIAIHWLDPEPLKWDAFQGWYTFTSDLPRELFTMQLILNNLKFREAKKKDFNVDLNKQTVFYRLGFSTTSPGLIHLIFGVENCTTLNVHTVDTEYDTSDNSLPFDGRYDEKITNREQLEKYILWMINEDFSDKVGNLPSDTPVIPGSLYSKHQVAL